MDGLLPVGRYCYAAAAVASGVQQIVSLKFVRLVPDFPAWIPGHAFWAVLIGVVLVLAGAAMLTERWMQAGALVAGALLLLLFLGAYVPRIAGNPLAGYLWTNPCKTLALLGGAILVAGGAGLVLPRTARLAATLSGLMVFLWILLLHIPRAVGMHSAFELDGVFEATAIGGVCLMVACEERGREQRDRVSGDRVTGDGGTE